MLVFLLACILNCLQVCQIIVLVYLSLKVFGKPLLVLQVNGVCFIGSRVLSQTDSVYVISVRAAFVSVSYFMSKTCCILVILDFPLKQENVTLKKQPRHASSVFSFPGIGGLEPVGLAVWRGFPVALLYRKQGFKSEARPMQTNSG